MPVYTFPYGASAFGVPQIAASYSIPISTGNYYWVSSVIGSNSNSGITPQQPFATIKYALSRCVANNYDCVIMMPGHAETISSAAYVTPVAGTTLCGIGTGSLRPTLTWSATTSTIVCSAANLTFQNFLCNNSITEVVTLFSVSAADVTFNGVDYNEAGGAYSVVSFVTGTSAATRLAVQNCFHTCTTVTTTAGAGWINIVGGDGIKIWDNVFMLVRVVSSATAGAIVCLTTASTNMSILRNTIGCMNSATAVVAVSLLSCCTGLVAYNTAANLGKTALAGTLAIGGCMGVQNFAVHTITKNGLLDPVVDS